MDELRSVKQKNGRLSDWTPKTRTDKQIFEMINQMEKSGGHIAWIVQQYLATCEKANIPDELLQFKDCPLIEDGETTGQYMKKQGIEIGSRISDAVGDLVVKYGGVFGLYSDRFKRTAEMLEEEFNGIE